MHTVSYLRVVGCEHVTAKRAERKAIGETTEAAKEVYEDLPVQQSIISKPPQTTNSTSADVTYGGT